MITEVNNVTFTLIEHGDLFAGYREDIEAFWAEICRNDPNAYSDQVLSVLETKQDGADYALTIGWIRFHESFYSKMVGNIRTRTLFSGGYIVTDDGYFCVALDKRPTINLIGGVASVDDMTAGKYDPAHCLIREFREEVGLDITDEAFHYELKYMRSAPDDVKYAPIGLLYEVRTTMQKEELQELFRQNERDDELQDLLFFRSGDYSIFGKYKQRPYIRELFEQIESESV